MIFTDQQIKLMKLCRKNPITVPVACKKMKLDEDALQSLINEDDFAQCIRVISSDEVYSISLSVLGQAAIDNLRRDLFHYWFPVVASLVALAVSIVSLLL